MSPVVGEFSARIARARDASRKLIGWCRQWWVSLWHASHAHAMRRANSLVAVTSSGRFCQPQPGLTLVGQL